MKLILSILILIEATFSSTVAVEFTRAQAGKITQKVGGILEQAHYRQAPLDNAISENFLKNYFNALDYNHLIFLQSDWDEFDKAYGTALDEATITGDVTPAYVIFERYLGRLGGCHQRVEKLLQESFDFSKDESFLPTRNKAPWPKDEAEAEQLWRARIKYELLQGRLAKEKPEDTLKTISRRYQRLEKTMREYDAEEILQLYLSALARAYDPHSDYMSPTEASNFDIQNITLSLSGIGAQLQWEDGYTKVRSLVPGGPADLSKQLKPADRIIAVAQGDGEPVDTVEMPLNKVVNLIRGKKGTEVRLTILPGGSTGDSTKKVIGLIRDEIKLTEQFAKARIIEQTGNGGEAHRLGVITLPQFYDHCAGHVEKLISRLKKEEVSGLVLDLRRNGGGILDEAIELTGLFFRKGPVVQVKDHRKRTQVLRDEDQKVAYDGPLVLLVGRLSASASEIAAAALQDYGRALVVGDQATHGKGTVQTVVSLDQYLPRESVPNPGKLKVTVSKFYRVAGGTTQKYGVSPDITLPSLYDYLDIGEASLENCLTSDRTSPVEFPHLNRVKPFLAELQNKSQERIAHNTDFTYLNEDIELVKKREADKTVSLKEAQRTEVKNEQKARADARKKERAQRKSNPEKIFELNLEVAEKDKPLLPYAAGKQKENEELAAVSPAAEGADAEAEADPPADAQLEETLNILKDYIGLLSKAGPLIPAEKIVSTTP
ncbi:MAG: carboxy terminal-processing peptidase [Chloroflexi bacterium]|nr:carboxy terminal-processing peptidase [Chloroflexota bacterium]